MNYENLVYALIYLGLAVFFYYLSKQTYTDLEKYILEEYKTYLSPYYWGLFAAIITPYTYLRPTKDFKWAYFLLIFSPICKIISFTLIFLALGELGIFPIHWRPFNFPQ